MVQVGTARITGGLLAITAHRANRIIDPSGGSAPIPDMTIRERRGTPTRSSLAVVRARNGVPITRHSPKTDGTLPGKPLPSTQPERV